MTSKYVFINQADIIILALPTPLKKNLEPDLSYIKQSMDKMTKHLKKGQLISLESSTYPGTTEEIIGKKLKLNKFELSKKFFSNLLS